jgi:DNA-binding MarR family transcriptional regulator
VRNIIEHLNKAFESRVRLGIMSALLVNPDLDFLALKELLNVTDGNLSSHANALQMLNYLAIHKSFVGKKTKTSYVVTELGKKEFNLHLLALEHLIKKM